MARVVNYFQGCNEQLEAFMFTHDTRLFDSGLCVEVWDQFVLYQELSEILHEILKLEFRLDAVDSFSSSVLRRQDTTKSCLDNLRKAMLKGNNYCVKFWADRKKEIRIIESMELPNNFQKEFCDDWNRAEKEHEAVIKNLKQRLQAFTAEVASYDAVKSKKKLKRAANNLLRKLGLSTFSISGADKKDLKKFIGARMTRRRLDETVCVQTKTQCMELCRRLDNSESSNKKALDWLYFLSFHVLDIGRCIGTDIATLLLKRVEETLEKENYLIRPPEGKNRKRGGGFSFLFPSKRTFVFKFGNTEGLNVNTGNAIKFDSLGPFDAVQLDRSIHSAMKIDEEGLRLYLNIDKLPKKERDSVFNQGKNIKFRLSPKSKLSLDSEARASINIPENATHYCFVYPTTDTVKVLETEKKELVQSAKDDAAKNSEQLFLLLFVGGYLYLDCQGETETIVAVTGLNSNGSNLHFGLPYLIKPEEQKFQQVEDMDAANRFQDVTLEILLDMGVQRFAWFLPGELQKCDHGGFVYDCRDEKGRQFYQYFNLVHTSVGTSLRNIENRANKNTRKSDRKLAGLYETFFDDLPLTRLKTPEELKLEGLDGVLVQRTISPQRSLRESSKG